MVKAELLHEILEKGIEQKASDIHFSSGDFVHFRVHGDIIAIEEFGKLSVQDIITMISPIMNTTAKKRFDEDMQSDFAFTGKSNMRYRINAYKTIRGISVAFREINNNIRSLEELNTPSIVKKFAELNKGLVIVSGPTGSGKSTTLAAMIDHINNTFQKHIITIEDPVEFIHVPKKCSIDQREVGKTAKSFAMALKSVLREDPDVIMVGEMRDPETIKMALTAAETGHLVFATLHTLSAAKTVDRIIDACDIGEKEMVRSMLSTSLQAVVLQALLKKADGQGRVAAFEVMVATDAIKNLIREDKIFQIQSMMQTGSKFGMVIMKDSVMKLLKDGVIGQEQAREFLITLKEEQEIDKKPK